MRRIIVSLSIILLLVAGQAAATIMEVKVSFRNKEEMKRLVTSDFDIAYSEYGKFAVVVADEKDFERLQEMSWIPHEKQVDVALATRMMAMAAMPGGYDIGVLVSGDQDFLPVLRQVRELGRQTAIVTIYGAAAREFLSPQENGIGDYETVLLNNYVDTLRLVYDKRVYTCASCQRKFQSSYRPRRGENMYCNACRADYRKAHPMPYGEEID